MPEELKGGQDWLAKLAAEQIRFSFPRALRLSKPAQFKRVFSRSKRTSDRYFTVLCRANNLDIPRLGLAISKKHVRTAVERNRFKRLARENFRQFQTELSGFDLVIMARREANNKPSDELVGSLKRHFKKIAMEKCDA